MAGLMNMKELKFNIYAIISGIFWGVIYIGGGYLFGASWQYIEKIFGKLSLLFIILILLIYLIIKISKLFFSIISKFIKLLILSTKEESIEPHIIKVLKNKAPRIFEILKKRLDPEKETGLIITTGIIFTVFFTYLFFGIVEDIIFNDPLVSFDLNLFNFLQKFHTSIANEIFIFFTYLGSKLPIILFFY